MSHRDEWEVLFSQSALRIQNLDLVVQFGVF